MVIPIDTHTHTHTHTNLLTKFNIVSLIKTLNKMRMGTIPQYKIACMLSPHVTSYSMMKS